MYNYFDNYFLYLLFIDKKSAQKVWSNDLVYEKTFRLSSHTQGYSLIYFQGQGFIT